MAEPLELTANHSRRAITTALGTLGAVAAAVLAVATVVSLLSGPTAVESLECSVEAPSEACLARVSDDLRGLPDVSLGVWFYAQNSSVKRSPRRYLEAEASWARLLPADADGAEVAKRNDGRVPSDSAREGELRMREAVLTEGWAPKSSDSGLRMLAIPLGLGTVGTLALGVVMGQRSRKMTPIPVKLTDEHVSVGTQQQRIDDLLSFEVAPLRFVAEETELALPPGYELSESDHERLVEFMETALARSRDMFMDDED
ncbi:MAG: hypothetical protein R3F61_30045 [Myxococcota bacterium]